MDRSKQPSFYRRLRKKVVKCPLSGNEFLPLDVIDNEITKANVEAEIPLRKRDLFKSNIHDKIVQKAKKIFAILVLIGESNAIRQLLEEDLTDSDLPLSPKSPEGSDNILVSSTGQAFKSFGRWNELSVANFLEKQWLVQAPVFSNSGEHWKLNIECAMPFIESDEVGGSAYSIIHKCTLHQAHQEGFEATDRKIYVAVKQFRTHNKLGVFEQEKTNLEKLRPLKHQHMIRHYATCEIDNTYYVIFPWADGGDLWQYWEREGSNNVGEAWVFEQMLGLTEALAALHARNCRHGDLKPGNILVFSATRHPFLVIGDPGVSRFHKQETFLRQGKTITSATTPSYQAPEVYSAPGGPRSRRYDIWSLGCIFLEFAIWYLYDFKAVMAFQNRRLTPSEIYSCFYVLEGDGNVSVHPKVTEAISSLLKNPRCSPGTPFGSLITLINDGLLQLECKQRKMADEVVATLREIVNKVKRNKSLIDNRFSASKPPVFQDLVRRPISTDSILENPLYAEENEKLTSQGNYQDPSPPPARDSENVSDSGYGSLGITSLKLRHEIQPGGLEDINEPQGHHLEPDKDIINAGEESDTATIYSNTSSLRDPKIDDYISGFVEQLCGTLPPTFDEADLERVFAVLPELLKAFAVRFGHGRSTAMYQQVMYFVHKYRSQMTEQIRDQYRPAEGQNVEEPPKTNDDIPHEEKVSSWLPDVDNDYAPVGATVGYPNSFDIDIDVDVDRTHDIDSDDHSDMGLDEPDLPELVAYRMIIIEDPAYKWLISRILVETTLEVPRPNIANKIQGQILEKIVPPKRISRKAPQDAHRIKFELDWDPLAFFHEQHYQQTPSEILAHAITLTGSESNVQAATCLEYMTQSWPSTGPTIFKLLQRVLENGGNVENCSLLDRTHLQAFYADHRVYITATGDAYSVSEVGVQLGWLGAALRSSAVSQGVAYCEPKISSFTDGECTIGYQLEGTISNDSADRTSGNCWWNLFKNPVVVRGYPIPRRLVPNAGLEIPLDIMAALANARRTADFCGRTFIKGFSTMLAAMQIVGNTVFWHMFYNQDGSYISYEDSRVPRVPQTSPQSVKVEFLETSRHILGWCENVKRYTGAREANYKLGWSCLPDPNQKCAFDRISISGGKYITTGVSCAIGVKDKPVHISLADDYISMLYMIAERQFIFYDVTDRQAWMADGASALLHMLRASIRHHQNDRRLREQFLFDYDKFEEADTTLSGSDAAFKILANDNNQKLPFYLKSRESWAEKTYKLGQVSEEVKEKITHFCLKDRVDQICHILGQIIAHQDDVHTEAGVGFRLRHTPRRQLEGFDFMDVATGQGALWPKVATLHAKGAGWVDFTRAIHAITFFGTGFGELFQPVGDQGKCRSCWWNNSVPKGRDYLAVCAEELNRIVDRKGDITRRPWRLVNNIYWHTPDKSFEPCKCSSTSLIKRDRVQVLLPATFPKLWGRGLRSPAILPSNGMALFGHSWKFPLRWKDGCVPNEGEPESSGEDDGSFHDSGLGSSNLSSREGEFTDSASPFLQTG